MAFAMVCNSFASPAKNKILKHFNVFCGTSDFFIYLRCDNFEQSSLLAKLGFSFGIEAFGGAGWYKK